MRKLIFRQWDGKRFYYWGYLEEDNVFTSPIHGDSQQFTELFDKNGKEIYEGDIIRLWYDSFQQYIKAVVEFRSGGFWFVSKSAVDCNWHHYNVIDREVIGNIYESPDFLKEDI